MTTNDTSSNGGGGVGVGVGNVDEKDCSIYCTFQSGDDCDKSFSQKRRSAVHKLRLDDGKKSVYWLDGSSSSSGAAAAADKGEGSSSHSNNYDYYKTVAPAHIYIHKQQRPLEESSSRGSNQTEQQTSPPGDPYDHIFLLGGFQLVSNAKAIEVYITKAKMSSSSGKYKVSSKEEYLTTIRGYLVKNSAAAAPSSSTSASSTTETSTDNDDNSNTNNNSSNDCLYKVLCVVPGGPRPVYCVHLKLLSLQQQPSSSNSNTTMTTTATTEQSRIARVYWMKLTARLPPPQESAAATATSGAQASSPFFYAADTPSPSASNPIAQVSVSEATAAVMNLMQPTPATTMSSGSSSGLSSSATSTALNPLFAPAPLQQQSTFTTTHHRHQQQQQYTNCNTSSSAGISGDDLGAAMAGLNFTIRGSEERMTKQIRQLFHALVVAQKQQQQQQAQVNMAVIPGMQEQLRQVTTMMSSQAIMLQQQQILLQQQNRLLIHQAQYMQALQRAQVEMKESLDRHMTHVAALSPAPASPPPAGSGQDDLIVLLAAMPQEPEICPAPALALVGQSSSPELNDNASTAVTDDEHIASVAVVESEISTNQKDNPCPAAASDNMLSEVPEVVVEDSGPDGPIRTTTTMPHELEIASEEEAAAATTIGQPFTPELNDASTAVTDDEPIMSVAIGPETPVNLNDKPRTTASSVNKLPETPEVVLAGDSGRDDPISTATAMPNALEMATAEMTTTVGQSSSPEQNDNTSTIVITRDEPIMAVESEPPTNQNDKTCTTASENDVSEEPETVSGDSGQYDPFSSTTTMPNEPEIATADTTTTTTGQSSTPDELNDNMCTSVTPDDEPNMAIESETSTNQNEAASESESSEPAAVTVDSQAATHNDATAVMCTESPEDTSAASAAPLAAHSENQSEKDDNTGVENDRHDVHDASAAAQSNDEPLHGYNIQSLASLVP